MFYPGRNIKAGEKDAEIVKALKKKLNETLGIEHDPRLRLDPEDPNFGPKMKETVKLFQARQVDSDGRVLKQDGVVGAITWGALFGMEFVPINDVARDPFLRKVLRIAASEEAKQVREVPKYSNRGPEVDQYLLCAGVPLGSFWCCAFVYWCFNEAAEVLECSNPMVKTAHCLTHWRYAGSKGVKRIGKKDAVENPALIYPGMILIIDHGEDKGHTGFVEKLEGALLTTIEGNIDASKTRAGWGVYRLTRKVAEINMGFIDYSGL